jgi:precorrin-2 dehydrogenase/sirohydrochlorin ferrochelatase
VVSQALVKKLALDLAVALAGDEMLRFVDRLGELRAELPFEGHAERMSEAVRGFVLEASLRFPAWFQRGDDRP